jgi:hypothetical protein
MPISALDILDSAVKIGLGAAITAIAGLSTAKLSHSNDRDKDIRSHKLRTLESISEKCDAYFNAYTNFVYRCNGIRKVQQNAEAYIMPEDHHDFATLCALDAPLQQALGGFHSATGMLRLLSADAAVKVLDHIRFVTGIARNRAISDRIIIGPTEAQEEVKKLMVLKDAFYKELSIYYSGV